METMAALLSVEPPAVSRLREDCPARGQFEESMVEAMRAVELDPVNLFVSVNRGSMMTLAGMVDEAIEQLRKTLELNPDYVIGQACLAHALLCKKRYAEAVAILEQWKWSRMHLAQAHALAGDEQFSAAQASSTSAGISSGLVHSGTRWALATCCERALPRARTPANS